MNATFASKTLNFEENGIPEPGNLASNIHSFPKRDSWIVVTAFVSEIKCEEN